MPRGQILPSQHPPRGLPGNRVRAKIVPGVPFQYGYVPPKYGTMEEAPTGAAPGPAQMRLWKRSSVQGEKAGGSMLQGIGISPGVALGKALLYREADMALQPQRRPSTAREQAAFLQAVEEVKHANLKLAATAEKRAGERELTADKMTPSSPLLAFISHIG